MSLRAYCRHKINVESNAGTPDGAGNVPPVWRVRHANVRCRFIPAGSRVYDRFLGRVVKDSAHFIIPGAKLAIDHTDRIMYEGAAFRVVDVQNPHVANQFTRVDVERWE